jgi:ABC-type multidrug transport system ATPase subunit
MDLSAGEKQKLEILKQLFLKPRLLILDEPTSVLTPQEADEVLGALRERAHAGDCSVLMITHKFREVSAYADDVSVLRRGRLVHTGAVADTTPQALAEAMVGGPRPGPRAREELASRPAAALAPHTPGEVQLDIRDLTVRGDRGEPAVRALSLAVRAGEIVGVAGVSGNGQRELMEALVGQRARESGQVRVAGQPFAATRAENQRLGVRALPEEPLRNACVGALSVADNMGLRTSTRRPSPAAAGAWVAACAPRPAPGSASTASRPRASARPSAACPAAMCSAPCWPASWPASRACCWSPTRSSAWTSPPWPTSTPGCARPAPRLRGAAGQRGPGRAAGPGRPHRRDERRPDRAGPARRRGRPPGPGRPHGRRPWRSRCPAHPTSAELEAA